MEDLVKKSLKNKFWEGRKVLVTGHTGFKGSWLSLWLMMKGAEVWGYSLLPLKEKSLFNSLQLFNKNTKYSGIINSHIGDINDSESLKSCIEASQPDIVFHLAAQPLVRESYLDPLGTWKTNLLGTIQLLENLKQLDKYCSVVVITTDKVYKNHESKSGYRESDELGGHDPYSASKAATELAVDSWRSSFIGFKPHQTNHLSICTARAGNVIGGGDWAKDRVIPDAVKAISLSKSISIRNPKAIRPWQHVLDPLNGYLLLAENLHKNLIHFKGKKNFNCSALNFGPGISSKKTVKELIESFLKYWEGDWVDKSDKTEPHETSSLYLISDKAKQIMGWEAQWNFEKSVERTATWYRKFDQGNMALDCCLEDIYMFEATDENRNQ